MPSRTASALSPHLHWILVALRSPSPLHPRHMQHHATRSPKPRFGGLDFDEAPLALFWATRPSSTRRLSRPSNPVPQVCRVRRVSPFNGCRERCVFLRSEWAALKRPANGAFDWKVKLLLVRKHVIPFFRTLQTQGRSKRGLMMQDSAGTW